MRALGACQGDNDPFLGSEVLAELGHGRLLNFVERLAQVGDQVFHIFDAQAQAYKLVADAQGLTPSGGHPGVTHDRQGTDHAFDPTQAWGRW